MNSLKAKAHEVAARARLREIADAVSTAPVSHADPDARESVVSSSRMIWPTGAVRALARVRVIRNPVRLYEDVDPDVVRPAAPVR